MKKLLLSVSLVALFAAPCLAYENGDQILDNTTNSATSGTKNLAGGGVRIHRWIDGTASPGQPVSEPGGFVPLGEEPTRPIPEPGTMVLASFGLLALGASRARRRGR